MEFALLCTLILFTSCATVIADSHQQEVYDVLILGGGMAGVSAANTLQSLGVTNFLIIEGRSEIGGRTQAGRVGDYVVEGGSLWVHKALDQNPLYKLALKYNISLTPADYDDWVVLDEEGTDVTEEADAVYDNLLEALDQSLNFMASRSDLHPDVSIRSALRRFGFNPETPVEMICEYFQIDFELAERPDISSMINMETVLVDKKDFVVVEKHNSAGYARLTQTFLEDGVPDWRTKTHFNTTVYSINYTNTEVTVGTSMGNYRGKKVIVTFSLGVLQHRAVKFYPQLPDWKEDAIQSFQFVQYLHFYLKFPSNMEWFVPNNTEWIAFASSRRGYYTYWQNFDKFWPGSHIIQGALVDQEARRVTMLSDEAFQSEAMSVLRQMFGPDIPDPEDFFVHRFASDPFFYGTYSNWPVGFTKSQYEALKAHINPVFFAGEAYDDVEYGYLHGALQSGERVAKALNECLQDHSQCPPPYIPPYEYTRGCTYRMASNYDSSAQIDDGSCIIIARSPIGYLSNSSHKPIALSVVFMSLLGISVYMM